MEIENEIQEKMKKVMRIGFFNRNNYLRNKIKSYFNNSKEIKQNYDN